MPPTLLKKSVRPTKKTKWTGENIKLDPPINFFLLFMEMVILSASVERFSVSCMHDFPTTRFLLIVAITFRYLQPHLKHFAIGLEKGQLSVSSKGAQNYPLPPGVVEIKP